MKADFYVNNSGRISSSKYGEKAINAVNNAITFLVYIAFGLLLLYELINKNFSCLIRILLTTGIPFIAVSVFRRFCNAKRPYEKFDYKPVLHKDSKGKSFPSRHVFSVFVIAMAHLYVSVPLGIAMLILGCVLATVRVIGGVHFFRDVAVGAALGILFGLIGFFWI